MVAGWAISIPRTILDTVGAQYVLADLNRRSLARDITGAWNFYTKRRHRRVGVLPFKNTQCRLSGPLMLCRILNQSHEEAATFRKRLSGRVQSANTGLARKLVTQTPPYLVEIVTQSRDTRTANERPLLSRASTAGWRGVHSPTPLPRSAASPAWPADALVEL
jgi:hypothetical protein